MKLMDMFTILLLIVGGVHVSSRYIQMCAPRYASKNQSILLNCTTSKAPIGDYAEFLVNGETYTSLQKHNSHCIVGNTDINCDRDVCRCSYDSLWYSLWYNSYTNEQEIKFKCVMKYWDVGKQFDEIITTIIDIKGPFLSSNKKFPLVAGIEAEIRCNASVTDVQIQIVWDCGNTSINHHSYHTNTEYISTFTFVPSSITNEINCKCMVKIDDFVSTTNITLEVTHTPFLKLSRRIMCSSTASTVISCEISGELSKYGFRQWIHSFNGEQIRKLNGTVVGNSSFLVIHSCGYQDIGTYTCRARSDHKGHVFLANRTTRVEVVGKPVIVKTYIRRESTILLAVKFYSNPKALNVQWYFFNEPISNSTNYTYEVYETNVALFMFGKRIYMEGYANNITLSKPLSGQYIVIIENAYGKTQGELELTIKGSTYKLTVVLLILTGVGVFISTVTMSALFTKRHSRNFSTVNIAAIYHAAPATENQITIYDIPVNQYEECEEIEGASEYLEVVSSSCSESDDQYEEVQ